MSRIFSKFVADAKVSAQEIGEFTVDASTIRQTLGGIENAKQKLAVTKQDLLEIPAKEVECEREIQRLQQEINNYEILATEALKKGKEPVVEAFVEKLTELHARIATQQAVKIQYSEHVKRLKDLMKKSERALLEHERELAMAKTTDSVQKAIKSIVHCHTRGSERSVKAKHTLDRIMQRQKADAQRWAAEEKLENKLSIDLVAEKPRPDSFDSKNAKNILLQRIHKLAGK